MIIGNLGNRKREGWEGTREEKGGSNNEGWHGYGKWCNEYVEKWHHDDNTYSQIAGRRIQLRRVVRRKEWRQIDEKRRSRTVWNLQTAHTYAHNNITPCATYIFTKSPSASVTSGSEARGE